MTTEQLSWRDPSGFVLRQEGRIFRAVVPEVALNLRKLLNSPWVRARIDGGTIQNSSWLSEGPRGYPQENQFHWLEHEVLDFPCYPHEITALQLYDAARLTLEIAREALEEGWLLKDASAWNVLFDNGKPLFCDILSFDPLGTSGIWPAYAQYCRHFVIPLLLHKQLGVQPAELFLVHRDGVTPEQARPMIKGICAWRQPALEVVTLPQLFAKKGRTALASLARKPSKPISFELAKYLLRRTFWRLEKNLEAVKPNLDRHQTVWANYQATRNHYSGADMAEKLSFVCQALMDSPVQTVLDLGCNAGEISLLAASQGKKVVAADFDHGALSQLYANLRRHPANISPVLLDLGRPTPAVGWMNREIASFMHRAHGKFDCVIMLGLIHHLLVSERAPLQLILQLIQALEPRTLIIEWIDPSDPRFVEIAGLNQAAFEHLSAEKFEAVFAQAYRLIRKQRLPDNTRVLYQWERGEVS